MGALALTYKQQYKTPFSPMIGGAKMVKWLDFDAVAEAVQKVSLIFWQHDPYCTNGRLLAILEV